MALQAANINDLVKDTLNDLGRGKFTDVASDLQKHVFFNQIMRKNKVKFDSGIGIQWNILINYNDEAQQVGLYGSTSVDQTDGTAQASMPWRHTKTGWTYDERELKMNRSPAKIVDYVKSKEAMALGSLAEHVETQGWSKPTTSSDTDNTHGLQYWVVTNATKGFNGGAPSGFTDVAGITPAASNNWYNWTDTYSTFSKDESTGLIPRMREAYYKTDFMPPIGAELPTFDRGNMPGIYMDYVTFGRFNNIGEAQNENLGRDIASMDGKLTFRGTPLTWVPKFDSLFSDNRVYMLQWGEFYPVILADEFLLQTGPRPSTQNPRVQVVEKWMTWNLCCKNRRTQAVIYNTSPVS